MQQFNRPIRPSSEPPESINQPTNDNNDNVDKPKSLSKRDVELLAELVEKYRAYKKPTSQQTLLMTLADKHDKTNDDIKALKALLSAERALIVAREKAERANAVIKAERVKETKKANHRKILLGSVVQKYASDNEGLNKHFASWADLKKFLISHLNDKDKTAFD